MVTKAVVFVCALMVVSSVFLVGCNQGSSSSGSSQQAIDATKSMATVQEKAQYLVQEAKNFYNSKKFQDAVNAAQYVLQYLDKNSQDAKSLLEQAKSALSEKVQNAVGEATNKLGSFGSK